MGGWSDDVEHHCNDLVRGVCDESRAARERDQDWRSLVVATAPYIQRWAAANRLLRRARLTGEDDVRAVLVAVLERLSRRGFANLKAYLARRPSSPDDAAEVEAVEEAVRLCVDVEMEDGTSGSAPGLVSEVKPEVPRTEPSTPLRGWLIVLTGFAAKDHVKRRLGWAGPGAGGSSKRSLGTDAARLDDAPEPTVRPPMTDLVAMRAVLEQARQKMAEFPTTMRRALEMWMADESFERIAEELQLADAKAARAKVRAGQARLRHYLRGAFSSFD